jgi:hypothetical protein
MLDQSSPAQADARLSSHGLQVADGGGLAGLPLQLSSIFDLNRSMNT